MIFNEDVFYNLKPEDARISTTYAHKFYNSMTEPLAILGLLAWACGWGAKSLYPVIVKKFHNGEHYTFLWLMLAGVTLFVGVKIMHSLYWAKRDYSRIEFDGTDILVFLAVLSFTSGAVLVWFDEEPLLIIAFYFVLCIIAVANFIHLHNTRIPADSRHYDVEVEKGIQKFNAVVFSLSLLMLALAALQMLSNEQGGELWPCIDLIPILLCMPLSIIHSHQLSAWPKVLINNNHLAPEKIEERVDAIFGVDKTVFKDKRAIRIALRSYKEDFKPIRIRRAEFYDIKFVTDLYIKNFDYILNSLTLGAELSSRDLMVRLLKACGGLGWLGILRFYIIEVDGDACGFVLPEFRGDPKIYTMAGQVSIAFFLLRRNGIRGLSGVYSAARNLRALQPRPRLKELRINYIAIVEDKQRQGIASRAIFLIKQAFIDSSTNEFRARTISAFIREKNLASVKFFESVGFSRQETLNSITVKDSLEQSAGKLIRFTLGAR